MFSLSSSQRYFLYSQPTDIRKVSMDFADWLAARWAAIKGQERYLSSSGPEKMPLSCCIGTCPPLEESGGFVLYYKRLEKGTFELGKSTSEGDSLPISWPSLVLLIEGIKLEQYRQNTRYKAL